MNKDSDEFTLYDLRVEVIGHQDDMACSHHVGDYFVVEGENLCFPGNTRFSLYALSALLPLLPAKQRETSPNDWMGTHEDIACPDPLCGARFRITRTGKRTFRRSEVAGNSAGAGRP